MASKESLQTLHDAAQRQIDQCRQLQNNIKRLNSAKKENDIQQHQDALVKFIENLNKELKDFHSKVYTVHRELTKAAGSDQGSDDDSEEDSNGESEDEDGGKLKRITHPDDQEVAYQLKARMMPQIFAQSQNLKAELVLLNRRNFLREQRKQRETNYNRETNLSAVTTIRAIQLYERKAKEAETRAEELQRELDELKSQNGSESGLKSQAEGQGGDSFLGPNNRVNDVIRKNELLIIKTMDQRREIQRLKQDNASLMKRAKDAQHDRHLYVAQLSTSEKARRNLHTRLQKTKAEHNRLSRSLARRSSEWIEGRKEQYQAEDEWRWKQVGYAAPHGSKERAAAHHIPRKNDQPRMMFPVAQYATASA